MKKILTLLSIAIVGFTSCEEEEINGPDNGTGQEEQEYSISISPTELTFGAEGGEQSVTATAKYGDEDARWKIYGESDWCEVSTSYGESGDKVTFNAKPYDNTEESRTATFTFYCGDKDVELVVTQEVKVYSISVEPAELTFEAEGGGQTLTVVSSDNWHIDGRSDWCKFSSYYGHSGDEITVTVSSFNYDNTDRTCTFMFICGDTEIELSVTQKKDDSPIIQFSNAEFKDAVLLIADVNIDNEVSEAEAAHVKILELDRELTDLSDIKYFRNLVNLDCRGNQLTTLDLSNNTALTELHCSGNQLTSLDVSKNTALTVLYCSNNQLTSLDVSNNPALTDLYCNYNQLTSLDLSNNIALTYLYCSNNQLTSLYMGKCKTLKSLDCNENQLTSLDLSGYTELGSLSCASNNLTMLNVRNCVNLSYINCGYNQLSVLDLRDSFKRLVIWLVTCDGNPLERIVLSKDVGNSTGLQRLQDKYGDIITYVD